MATAIVATAALALAGCSGSASSAKLQTGPPAHLSGTVSLWHFFTDREAKAIQSVVDDFEKNNPGVKVEVHTGQDDSKLAKVIATGGNIDVALSGTTDNVGTFCSSGAFRDLSPYMARDKINMSQFLGVTKAYTSFAGKQCSLPMLADAHGLYYNIDQLKAAGFSDPPKTLDELETMALKLTTYNPDGSIKTLGFNPLIGFYHNVVAHLGAAVGGTWIKDGKSAISESTGWPELMTWQKQFVDKIGYAKLKAFSAGAGDEFSATNAFQTGQIAMILDGEWRVAFIADQKPTLNYGTAPFPTAADHTDLYGGSYMDGTIAGIAKGSKNPELSWALLKYLTTDTGALVKLANGIKNVPTTLAALNSPDLSLPAQFKTFLTIAASPNLFTVPVTTIGGANQNTFTAYWNKYQAGDGGDLAAGLKKVDVDINNALALNGP